MCAFGARRLTIEAIGIDGQREGQEGFETARRLELFGRPVVTGDDLVEDIRGFCADRIAKYKMPRTIDFIDKLPREANGKLMKRKLRDPYWEGRERAI